MHQVVRFVHVLSFVGSTNGACHSFTLGIGGPYGAIYGPLIANWCAELRSKPRVSLYGIRSIVYGGFIFKKRLMYRIGF